MKLTIDLNVIGEVYPEALEIPNLPRKKKKEAKKKLIAKLMEAVEHFIENEEQLQKGLDAYN